MEQLCYQNSTRIKHVPHIGPVQNVSDDNFRKKKGLLGFITLFKSSSLPLWSYCLYSLSFKGEVKCSHKFSRSADLIPHIYLCPTQVLLAGWAAGRLYRKNSLMSICLKKWLFTKQISCSKLPIQRMACAHPDPCSTLENCLDSVRQIVTLWMGQSKESKKSVVLA